MLLLAAFLVAGCLPLSLQPWYASADPRQVPRLLGNYRDTPDHETLWSFRAGKEPGTCLLEVREENTNNATMKAVLFEVEGKSFLDLTPDEDALGSVHRVGDLAVLALVSGHLLARTEWVGEKFQLNFLDHDWVKAQVAEPAGAHHGLRHEIVEGKRLLLTASTPDLQKFLSAAARESVAWGKPIILERVSDPQPPIRAQGKP